MKLSEMLHTMCQDELSTADIKAISKSRGFSAHETKSRALFENFFLSSIGVESVLRTLTEDEIALLHLLHFKDQEVNISFFQRIYGVEQKYWETYNQRYKSVVDQVNTRLIRAGVLVYAELNNISAGQTKLERRRFRFPPEFAQYLPRMTQSSVKSVEQGIVQDGFRAQLAQLIRPDQSTRVPRLRLVEGELRLGGHFFEIARLSEWRQAAWENAITQIMYSDSAARGMIRGSDDIDYNETPLPFIRYLMGQLAPDEWLMPSALTTPLRVFYRGHSPISADKLCQLGWEHGCLAQLIHQKQAYYRPAVSTQFQPDKSDPSAYFQPTDHGVIINTKTIPYESLEMVNRIAMLQVNRHQLEAVPDIVRMSKAFLTMREHPVIDWLTEHSPDFRKARNTINTEWGKLIVHENLLAARVTNLSLRVTLEKTFGDQIIVLSNQFIAFPLELRREIEKMVSKAGHVVKVSRHGA